MPMLFYALKHRHFALLWSGQTISRLGDDFYRIALVWWVIEKTDSAVAMGTVLILTTTPMLLFILLGGALVDRLPRLPLMLVSDFVRGTLVGLMALMSFADALQIWHIYVISLIFGFLDSFFIPAYRAAVPELTPPELLPGANSLTSLSREISGIIGPALGASLVALGGSAIAFGLNALSFFISALCLLPILNLSKFPKHKEESRGILLDVKEGLGTVFGTPWLWITIAVAGISNITYAAPMGVALPFLVKDHLQADVKALGFFYTFMSLGAMLAAIWLGRYSTIRRRGLKLYGAWMLIGIMVAVIGLPVTIYGVLFAALIIGGANTAVGLLWVNALQDLIPHEMQGRVSSVDYLGSYILEPVGYAVGGWATQLLGPVLIFVIGGLLQSGLIGVGLLHPKVRNLD
jgi:MFS family permease